MLAVLNLTNVAAHGKGIPKEYYDLDFQMYESTLMSLFRACLNSCQALLYHIEKKIEKVIDLSDKNEIKELISVQTDFLADLKFKFIYFDKTVFYKEFEKLYQLKITLTNLNDELKK